MTPKRLSVRSVLAGSRPATSAVAAMIGASTSTLSPWLTIVAEPAARTLRTQSALVPYGRAIRNPSEVAMTSTGVS